MGKSGLSAVASANWSHRFMRNLRLLLNQLHELDKVGVGFVSVQESIDTSVPNGKLPLQIMGVIAEFERERIGERITDARRQRLSEGKWSAGSTLYGYKWNKSAGIFEVVEDEARVVKQIYRWYTEDNLGMKRIVEKLSKMGSRTRRNKLWSLASVRYTLVHEAYKGEVGTLKYPALVDNAIWDRAQSKRLSGKIIKRELKNWLLQGITICGLCGHRLRCHQSDPGSRRTYQCRGRDKMFHLDGSDRCNLPIIDANWWEKEVWSKFAATASDSGLLRHSVDEALAKLANRKKELEAATKPIDRQLERVNNQIEKLVLAFSLAEDELNDSSRSNLKEKLAELKKQKAGLEERRGNLNPTAQTEVAQLEEYIQGARKLLESGGIALREDGIWGYTFNKAGGIIDAENFGVSMDLETEVEERTKTAKQEKREENGEVHFDIPVDRWSFEHPAEARIKSMRAILSKFDVKVLIFPDKVEIRGQIPTKILAIPPEAMKGKVGQDINSVERI